MAVSQAVEFNGVTYRLMGAGRYYLSQSTTNVGRKGAKGLHVAVWEFYSGETVPPGYEVHHIDGDCFNNDYSNLACISVRDHRRMWVSKDREKMEAHLESIRPLTKAWHTSPEGHDWHVQHGRECAEKREAVTLVCECCGEEFKAKNRYARFCSHNCSVKWHYAHGKTPERRVCVICGAEFETQITSRGQGASTCSFECRGKLNARNQKQKGSGVQSASA